MQTIKWTGKNGNEIELRAECKITMIDEVLYADGWDVETGKKKQRIEANLELYIDGKKIESCWDTNFWKIINLTGTPHKRIWGIEKMGMTAEQAEKVDEFLKSVIADGKTEEAKEASETEAKEIKVKEIEEAKNTVAKAEAQDTIPTEADYKVWRKQYNDMYNEGGEGFIPTKITAEQYEHAKSILNK